MFGEFVIKITLFEAKMSFSVQFPNQHVISYLKSGFENDFMEYTHLTSFRMSFDKL